MRELATKPKIVAFMFAFARAVRSECHVYFSGGATVVLMGWRESTLQVDLRIDPELDELFHVIPAIKEELQINIELSAPSDSIPPLPGWQKRSRYIGREGMVSFFYYDPYSQALEKIERGLNYDLEDVGSMLEDGLIEPQKLIDHFTSIEPELYKYPSIDPASFSNAVIRLVNDRKLVK